MQMPQYVAPILQAKMTELASIISELLAIGKEVRLTVTGNSMYPFLRENRDSVILKSCSSCKLKKVDIVLIVRPNGQYVLHRIVKMNKGGFYILGDAQTRAEGPITPDCLIARVSYIIRNEKTISAGSFTWRALSLCWIILRPARRIIIKTAAKIPRRKVRK